MSNEESVPPPTGEGEEAPVEGGRTWARPHPVLAPATRRGLAGGLVGNRVGVRRERTINAASLVERAPFG